MAVVQPYASVVQAKLLLVSDWMAEKSPSAAAFVRDAADSCWATAKPALVAAKDGIATVLTSDSVSGAVKSAQDLVVTALDAAINLVKGNE